MPSPVFSDIGRKPTVTLSFDQLEPDLQAHDVGSPQIIVCWDTFIPGGNPEKGLSKEEYALLKPVIEEEGLKSCRRYNLEEGKIKQSFYKLPGRLLVLYPTVVQFHYILDFCGKVDPDCRLGADEVSPRWYLSVPVKIGHLQNFDYSYQATLHSENTVTLVDTTDFSVAMYRSFIQILIITLLIELAVAACYCQGRLGYPGNSVKCWIRFVSAVIISNLLSLHINHFLIFAMIPSFIRALLIAELIAIVSEAIVIKALNKEMISWSHAIGVAVWMNLISLLWGSVLLWPIYESSYGFV